MTVSPIHTAPAVHVQYTTPKAPPPVKVEAPKPVPPKGVNKLV